MPPAEVAAELAERIWSGEAAVGIRLDSERRLAARFGVSRPTVRRALRRLAAQHLVRIIHGRHGGAVVEPGVVPPALLPLPLTTVSAASLLEARRTLEPAVARLAAERATVADLLALDAAVREQRDARDGWAADLQRDARFHLLIARATHNPVLVAAMRTLHRDLYRSRFDGLRTPHSPRLLAQIHARTVLAIRSRDPIRIERDLREHLGWLERVPVPTPGSAEPADRSDPAAAPRARR